MPFWWRRRRKPWYGRWFTRRRRRPWGKRRRRRIYKRRRTRKLNRRRRRRRYKVRRKKQTITVKQWQPDSIRKCFIKGHGTLVVGAEGTQMFCYTKHKFKYVPPKTPYGGGFGAERYTLKFLYEEYQFHNNIWTASNLYKDLCRFIWVKFIFYRHPETDFVVSYNRQPPWDLNKFTYPSCHPQQMLLEKHKKIVLSQASKPNGKYKVKVLIKPTKQLISKWFFTKPFSDYGLLFLKGSALNLRYSFLSASNENMLVNISSLNPSWYINTDWARARADTQGYLPQNSMNRNLWYENKIQGGTTKKTSVPPNVFSTYGDSVDYTKGWFNPNFLRAIALYSPSESTKLAQLPLNYGRYNPTRDKGTGNKIYIISTIADGWGPPTTDKNVLITDMPLWLGLYGYVSYLETIKPPDWLKSSLIVIESDYIYHSATPVPSTKWAPIDSEYIDGKKPYGQIITEQEKKLWYPNYKWQLKTLNAIVECGPFIQQYSEEKNSTWELKYFYNFYFKWGGPQVPGQDIKNPQELNTYDVPDKLFGKIQITNPAKQAPETILQPWDYRRGLIKETALKRMCTHLETDSEFEYSPEQSPKKKKQRIGAALRDPQEEIKEAQNCLLSLCEESTCQDPQNQTLEQLIQHQQHKQQQLRYNIVKLLIDLKEKQKMIQLQTGLLE
nr:MAG: ORF1 [Torque teno midi virus]